MGPIRPKLFFLAALAFAGGGVIGCVRAVLAAEPLPGVSVVASANTSSPVADPLRSQSMILPESSLLRPDRVAALQDRSAAQRPGDGGRAGTVSLTSTPRISGNPGATNVIVGSGWLGDYLGINRNGWRFAGFNIVDANGLAGGLVPGWTSDSLTIADISIDTEEAMGWSNGLIGMEFLYYSGGPVNADAGTVMGYNALDVVPPDNRAEFYQLWYLHKFFKDRLLIRIGKTITTYDFNNVIRTVPHNETSYDIAATSALIFTPLYVSPTQLGIVPGYYNSATGVTATVIPTESTYVNYALYDGNLANGRQTGLEGPHFNGYMLHLVEVGGYWKIGVQELPGKFGAGFWAQTGVLKAVSGPVNGAQGIYFFGSQHLYYEHPGETDQGLVCYYQFAATDSPFVDTQRYFGFGFSYFGPIPAREADSIGFGMAYGKMNDDPLANLGADEIILSWYYQWAVSPNCFLQPNLTYIPNPAAEPDIAGAFPITLRAVVLF